MFGRPANPTEPDHRVVNPRGNPKCHTPSLPFWITIIERRRVAMATTVDEGFRTLHAWLIPTETERAAASTHRESIVGKLKASLGVENFFQTGSFGNGTAVRPYSDVDYFASIPSAYQRDSSATMLEVLKTKLLERFPSTPIKIRTPAVICEFAAGAETYEIVPAYYQSQADGRSVYKIPAGGTSWTKAAPLLHNDYVTERNHALSSKVKPLIRFVKALRYYRNIPVSSFYLELRTAKMSEGWGSIVYSIDLTSVIAELISISLAQIQDPKGVSGYVGTGVTYTQKADALSKLQTASSRATNARQAEQAGKTADAFYWWNLFFDGHFPAYG